MRNWIYVTPRSGTAVQGFASKHKREAILLRKHPHILIPLGVLLLCLVLLAALTWRGVLWPNRLFACGYTVKGVDASAYQGEIDWPVLAGEGVDFAFIKATEGSGFVDPRFADNWRAAQAAGVRVGAYHFFSFDSPGGTQADRFIAAVPATEGMLPPAVDVELYGAHKKSPPDAETVRAELRVLLDRLEARYGVKPIIYTLESEYARYIQGAFDDYDLWIRNVVTPPRVSGWTFWQYSSRDRLAGYEGPEAYIDRNAFYGSHEALEALCVSSTR